MGVAVDVQWNSPNGVVCQSAIFMARWELRDFSEIVRDFWGNLIIYRICWNQYLLTMDFVDSVTCPIVSLLCYIGYVALPCSKMKGSDRLWAQMRSTAHVVVSFDQVMAPSETTWKHRILNRFRSETLLKTHRYARNNATCLPQICSLLKDNNGVIRRMPVVKTLMEYLDQLSPFLSCLVMHAIDMRNIWIHLT